MMWQRWQILQEFKERGRRCGWREKKLPSGDSLVGLLNFRDGVDQG